MHSVDDNECVAARLAPAKRESIRPVGRSAGQQDVSESAVGTRSFSRGAFRFHGALSPHSTRARARPERRARRIAMPTQARESRRPCVPVLGFAFAGRILEKAKRVWYRSYAADGLVSYAPIVSSAICARPRQSTSRYEIP